MIQIECRVKNMVNYMAVFSIFATGWMFGQFAIGQMRGFYPIMAAVFLLWLPFLKGFHINRNFLLLFMVLVLFSFCNVILGNDTFPLLMKQFFGVISSAIFFYMLFKINDYDIKGLFKIYLNIAFIIALIGIIQEVSFIIGFKPGYDYSSFLVWWGKDVSRDSFVKFGLLRVNSILPEPADFCQTMVPALFVSLAAFGRSSYRFLSRWKCLIIIAAYFLTFSTTGYLGVFFAILLLLWNFKGTKGLIAALLIICAVFIFMYNNIIDFQLRVNDVFDILKGHINTRSMSMSAYALYSNAVVAYKSFLDNPIFGSGLGSHGISYFKYIGDMEAASGTFGVNYNDASSLFLRLLSETGIIGLLMFAVFFFRFFVLKRQDKTGYLWIINNAVLCTFFTRFLRAGHYFYEGFFFFFWAYYFSKVALRPSGSTSRTEKEKPITEKAGGLEGAGAR